MFWVDAVVVVAVVAADGRPLFWSQSERGYLRLRCSSRRTMLSPLTTCRLRCYLQIRETHFGYRAVVDISRHRATRRDEGNLIASLKASANLRARRSDMRVEKCKMLSDKFSRDPPDRSNSSSPRRAKVLEVPWIFVGFVKLL